VNDRDSMLATRPVGGFQLIYADPAWLYANWSEKGEDRNANQHYQCMPPEDIKALPVGAIAGRNCILFLWTTDSMLKHAMEAMEGWGFDYKTIAFVWTKEKPSGAEHMGLGKYTRANPELCLLGTRGADLSPAVHDVRQWQHHPVREHSRKPDEFRRDIVRMYPRRRRIELFTRTRAPGWAVWGNETDKFACEGVA